MGAIRASHYGETEKRLASDPIIIAMAKGLAGVPREEMFHENGTARHEFMMAANREYRSRGGTDGGHIGAVANALKMILDN